MLLSSLLDKNAIPNIFDGCRNLFTSPAFTRTSLARKGQLGHWCIFVNAENIYSFLPLYELHDSELTKNPYL